MQYQPVEFTANGKTYKGTVSKQKPAYVPGENNTEPRYLFILDNWDGPGPGLLTVTKKEGKWRAHEDGAIMDRELAEAAGKAVEKLL